MCPVPGAARPVGCPRRVLVLTRSSPQPPRVSASPQTVPDDVEIGRDVDGVVLIGGASRRMGVDKAGLRLDGRSMADRVADALLAGGCRTVIGYGSGPRAEELDLDVHPDRFPGEGPLGGLVGALGVCRGEVVVVASCDLPFLDGVTVGRLVDALATVDAKGLAPEVAVATTDRRHHTCAAWARSAESTLLESFHSGTRALHRVIEALRCVDVAVEPHAGENVNTPDDLRRLGLSTATLPTAPGEAK